MNTKKPYDDLEDILSKYRELIDDSRILFDPDIPEDKIFTARSKYAQMSDSEKPLVLINTGSFGSAKTGSIITATQIYSRDPFNKARKISWGEVRSAIVTESDRVSEGNWLKINDEKFLLLLELENDSLPLLASMVQDIMLFFYPELEAEAEKIPEMPAGTFKKLDILPDPVRGEISISFPNNCPVCYSRMTEDYIVELVFIGGINDLVFPSSKNIHTLTVPSCNECYKKLSRLESIQTIAHWAFVISVLSALTLGAFTDVDKDTVVPYLGVLLGIGAWGVIITKIMRYFSSKTRLLQPSDKFISIKINDPIYEREFVRLNRCQPHDKHS